MPRRPREEEAGAIHHVYARGIDRRALFVDDIDRRRYLALLEHVVGSKRWRCLSYCLMGNHVHLMVETREPNLGRGMQVLHGDFAREINIRHDRSGHVFQGRYGSKRLRTEAHLWTTAAYIAANPVEAALAPTAEAWPWASHRYAAASGPAPLWLDAPRLFELFGSLGGDPRERYCELVRDRCAARAWIAEEVAEARAAAGASARSSVAGA
jgi:REP-associated tyrosine transposase